MGEPQSDEIDERPSADHARCLRCGAVVHLLLTAHHDLTCPPALAEGCEQ